MAVLKVYDGAVWVVAIGKEWDGTQWIEKMAFHDGTVFVDLYPNVSAQLLTYSLTRVRTSANCFSGIKLDSDGTVYSHTNSGGWTAEDPWLLTGTNSQVWVHAAYTGDALYISSAVGSRLRLNVDEFWRVRDNTTGDGGQAGTLTLNLYDAASGGTLLATRAYTLGAEKL